MRMPNEKIVIRPEQSDEMPPPAYFLSLTVENVRCFGPRQTLNLSDGDGRPRQWTILLGENGVGKTTLLQCLAELQATQETLHGGQPLYLPGRHLTSTMGSFIRNEARTYPFYISSSVCIKASLTKSQISKKIEAWEIIGRNTDHIQMYSVLDDNLSGLICFGYGASRRMGTASLSDSQSKDTAVSLFDDNATLINAEEWLLQADYAAKSLEGADRVRAEQRRDRIKEVLIGLLPDVEEIRFATTKSPPMRTTVEVKTPYGWVSIREMSLGYRTLMTWMVDFASRMFERYPDSPNPLAEPAIVLVDEIDLHLHPKWQRTLMQFLSERFPNTQFIATAHSPLVVQAATNANVVLLRREGDHVVIDNEVEIIKNWRIDQVLTSDLFGLETARPPQMTAALEERNRLLSKARLSAKDKARLHELETQIGDLPTGETPQDIEAMDIIRRAAELLKTQA